LSESAQNTIDEINVDENNLYREEIFTDLKVATIRRLTPIRPDGSEDSARPVLFMGQEASRIVVPGRDMGPGKITLG